MAQPLRIETENPTQIPSPVQICQLESPAAGLPIVGEAAFTDRNYAK
jgi:hypothetical protein